MQPDNLLLCILSDLQLAVYSFDFRDFCSLLLFGFYRHGHGCDKVGPPASLWRIRGLALFKGPGKQPAFLVVQDVSSDCLSEDFRVGVCVEPVVGNLEGESKVISVFVQQVAILLRCLGYQGSHFCGTCNQNSRLQPYHLHVVLHRHLLKVFEIHVVLLPFADFCRRS